MKNIIAIVMVVACCMDASAQSFQLQFTTTLPDTSTYQQIRYADFDNDSLLDVLVQGKNTRDQVFFSSIKTTGSQVSLFKIQ
jgi:hypothetical protein